MANEIADGLYTGTGAAINIELGWVPDYVEVINLTDGDDIWKWYNGATGNPTIYQRNVVDNGATGNSSMTRITANAVSAYNPANFTNKPGFTVGTAMSESGDQFGWIAIRKGDS
jgi:hypothetical protein